MLNEIETIKTKNLFFGDDNLFGVHKDRERSVNLFKGMIERKMNRLWATYASINFSEDEYVLKLASQSGCRVVYVGFESIDIENLKTMRKGINVKYGIDDMKKAIARFHKHGIAVIGGFFFGHGAMDPILWTGF